MFTTITTCQGCKCDILNERVTKGRLKKWCSNACRQKWRYKNDENIVNRNTYTEQKARGYSNKWKSLQYKGGKCQTCAEDRPAALCFHHRDPSKKELKLDGRSFANRKWKTIKEEVDKCDLLCHNCHNILHYGNSWNEFLETLV
jgi:hypothetical protein